MVELIVKRLRGEATDIESRQLEQWRTASPENEREYRELLRLWRRGEAPAMPSVPPPPLAEIVEEGDARRRRSEARASGSALLRSPWTAYGLTAAAVLVALFIGMRDGGVPGAEGTSLTPLESSSGPGQMITMSLSDGTVMRVAPETSIEFVPGAGRREVAVDGRVFFAVARDEAPFVVRTRAGEVRVRGTRFEVFTEGDELRVVVVEGTVELGNPHGATRVHEGQVAFLAAGSTARVVDRADVWTLLDWSGGLLLFQATPLGRVSEELERHFGRPFRITEESMRELRVTAWFEDETLEEVVSAVCIVAGARCSVDEAEVTIGR